MDQGPMDQGPMDQGPMDQGPMDQGPMDQGPMDQGPMDQGPMDQGPIDQGPVDHGPEDHGPVDDYVAPVDDYVAPVDDYTPPPEDDYTPPPEDVDEDEVDDYVAPVAPGNNAPVFTSAAAINVAENGTSVVTVQATDADADVLTYSITGGADAALFAINSSTGVLTFNSAPNYESPGDVGGDNIYDIIVTATDTNQGATTQNIAITVTDVSEGVSKTLSIADATVTEVSGESATLTITLSSAASENVTVNYATSNGTATTNSGNFSLAANANNDYTTTSGTATILAGQTTATITVPIYNDSLYEGNETVTVTLSNASGDSATISDATATLTIIDNEVVNNATALAEVTESSFGTYVASDVGALNALAGVDAGGWNLGANNVLTYTFYNQQLDGVGANGLDGGNPTYSWTNNQMEAVTNVLQSYSNVTNMTFQYVSPGEAGNYFSSGADISLFQIGDGMGENIYGSVGGFPEVGGNSLSASIQSLYGTNFTSNEGDVFINQTLAFTDSDIAAGGNGWNTLIHEIGHGLALSHSWDQVYNYLGFPVSNTTIDAGNAGPGGSGDLVEDTNSMLYSNMSYNAALWYNGLNESVIGGSWGQSGLTSATGTTLLSNMLYAPDYAGASQQLPISSGQPTSPMAYDMLALSYLYGNNTSYNAGDTTYTLTTDTTLQTIYDAGGTDTLDGSGINSNISLDLTLMPGDPSSAWFNGANISATSNTLIGGVFTTEGDDSSFSAVVIENAIGGSGDDILIGNTVANELTGGAGSDTLSGGSGNDVFVFNSLAGSDTITDWNTANDTLQFSATTFSASGVSGISAGSSVDAADLLTGANITNASSTGQTFLFDTDSAILYYDADGAGAGGAIQVADLGANVTIDQNDIVMIA
jgi:hypothetical protein